MVGARAWSPRGGHSQRCPATTGGRACPPKRTFAGPLAPQTDSEVRLCSARPRAVGAPPGRGHPSGTPVGRQLQPPPTLPYRTASHRCQPSARATWLSSAEAHGEVRPRWAATLAATSCADAAPQLARNTSLAVGEPQPCTVDTAGSTGPPTAPILPVLGAHSKRDQTGAAGRRRSRQDHCLRPEPVTHQAFLHPVGTVSPAQRQSTSQMEGESGGFEGAAPATPSNAVAPNRHRGQRTRATWGRHSHPPSGRRQRSATARGSRPSGPLCPLSARLSPATSLVVAIGRGDWQSGGVVPGPHTRQTCAAATAARPAPRTERVMAPTDAPAPPSPSVHAASTADAREKWTDCRVGVQNERDTGPRVARRSKF